MNEREIIQAVADNLCYDEVERPEELPEYCPLRNVPRDMPAVVTIADVLRGMGWGGRGGCRGRR